VEWPADGHARADDADGAPEPPPILFNAHLRNTRKRPTIRVEAFSPDDLLIQP